MRIRPAFFYFAVPMAIAACSGNPEGGNGGSGTPAGACTGQGTTVACRAAVGPCDQPEFCDGVGDDCPADSVLTAGTECRAAAGICDIAESCDGTAAACPTDLFDSSTECRASAGVCDIAESCDGTAAACPTDLFDSSNICRVAADLCDAVETCDGAGAGCPADAIATLGTECRAPVAPCDPAESCDGNVITCPANVACPIFVDGPAGTDAVGCGTTWSLACATVQTGTDEAVATGNDRVFVAAGAYTATPGNGTNEPVVTMADGVSLHGGFAGTEDFLSERGTPIVVPSVLDGDLTGDGSTTDDSQSVVIGSSNATLDGFVVQGGRAAGVAPFGGGMFNDTVTNLTVSHTEFLNNSAEDAIYPLGGGGMYIIQSTGVLLSDVIFDGNRLLGVNVKRGVGLYVDLSDVAMQRVVLRNHASAESTTTGVGMYAIDSNLSIDGASFVGNSNGRFGSGVGLFLFRGSANIANTLFEGNRGMLRNNGVGMRSGSAPVTLTNVAFNDNVGIGSASGGGLSIQGGPVTLSHVAFVGNSVGSSGMGGGMKASAISSLTLSDVSFVSNSAGDSGSSKGFGGGMSARNCTTTITNTTFIDNTTTGSSSAPGGGLYVLQKAAGVSTTTLTNVSFTGNSATNGGGFFVEGAGTVNITNGLFAGNAGGDYSMSATPTPLTFNNTCADDDLATIAAGDANVTAVGTAINGAVPPIYAPDGKPYIDAASSCVDLGDNAVATAAYTAAGLDWTTRTTSIDGTQDATPIDAGFHYDAVRDLWIKSLAADAVNVSWTTNPGTDWSCNITGGAGYSYAIPSTDIATGSTAHNLATGTLLTMSCDPTVPGSARSVATVVVP